MNSRRLRPPDELDLIVWAVHVGVIGAQDLGLDEEQLIEVVRETWRIRQEQQGKRMYEQYSPQ